MKPPGKPPSSLLLVFLLVIAGFLTGCAGIIEEIRTSAAHGKPATTADQPSALPTIIAIMPFSNQTREAGIEDRLRQNIYNQFNSKSFVDLELATVDEKIAQLEMDSGKNISDFTSFEICQAIGCDGLVFGKVIDYQKTHGVVFSNLGMTAEVWLVDAKNNKEIVRFKDSVNYLQGGVPLTPLGIIMTGVMTTANLREFQQTRIVNELSQKLVQKIPEPQVSPALMRPVITEVITNVGEGPFGRGGIIRVGLHGESGAMGAFDIGNFKQGLPLRETEEGIYLGEYAVSPGDSTRDMPITAYLKRPSGTVSQWVDTSGLVSIDTTVPPMVTELRAESFYDRVELSWEQSTDLQDLSGYTVYRSTHPLSGYEVLATSESNSYQDRDLKADEVYYYRIVAEDQSGNQSEFSATVKAGLAGEGHLVLTGQVRQDTVLSGNYTLKGQLTVSEGITLTIGPETTIMAEKGAGISVRGKLVVDGQDGQVRVFSRKNEKWMGIVSEEALVEINGFLLSGSTAGITLKNSEGLIENTTVIDNDLGIAISGIAPAVVRNCWIAGNGTGIEMSATSSKVLQSVITHNGIGLSLKNFTGYIRDNIIIDNDRNIFSDFPLKLAPNFIGALPNNRKPQSAGLTVNRLDRGRAADPPATLHWQE